ncbi:MAG: FKBP-type peptidylprolyl isomerase [Desulfobulbus propionicus]|nr:MAG: FKBP-type peptidylprolyl isomerase [Desulfobulbus propionicus]
MCPVQFTDTVTVSYIVTLDSGEVIEEVPEKKPVIVQIGSGRILKAVEACMLGMEPGETRSVRVLPEDAYGSYHKELVHTLPKSTFAGRIDPKPGMILSLNVEREGEAQQIPATVLSVDNDEVTVDYNHPLAGQSLNYDFKLHAIGT